MVRFTTRAVLLSAITSLTLFAQSTASIEGRVTNSVTGEAVGGVSVRFLDRHSYVYRTTTDSTGSYRLTGLDDGDYRGEFTKDGFSENTGNPFSHVSGFVPVRVDAQLSPWATLRGRVVDEDLKPLAGVRVEKDPGPPPGILDSDTVTDANGEFVFPNLAPGSYTVVAKPEPRIRIQDGERLGTVAIYYPSATALAQAVRIPVRTGQNVSGIEIRLKSVPVHRVAGVVLNEAGKPVAHATVKLMGPGGTTRQRFAAVILNFGAVGANGMIMATSPPEIYTITGPSPEPELARVESHDDGTFEFPAVEPGDWRLSAESGVADDMPLAGVASAPVSESDIEDIRIRLTPSFPVDITQESAQAPGSAVGNAISLGLTPVEGQPRVRTTSFFPGRYRVLAGAIQAGSHVTAVMWGGRDVNGQVVELTPGAAPFRVILSSGFGKVRGTVDKGEGSTVFLISREPGEILSYRQVKCRAGGVFEIGDVVPGDYYAVAFDRPDSGGLPAAELPVAIVPIASTLQVEAGSTASVDLKLNKWPW